MIRVYRPTIPMLDTGNMYGRTEWRRYRKFVHYIAQNNGSRPSHQFLVVIGKSSVSELHLSLNITTVIGNIIIKKRINYLPSDGKSTTKSV